MRKIILLISLLVITACTTLNQSTIGVPVNVSATTHLDVDVEVGEKIYGEANATILFGKWCIDCPNEYADGVFGGAYSPIKAAAVYEAVTSSDADLIVNPQYVVVEEKNVFLTDVYIKVTGYKGTINKIDNCPNCATEE